VEQRPRRSLQVLDGLRGRLRRLVLEDSLLTLAWGIAAALVASFVLDYFLILPQGVRFVFLLAGGCSLAYFVARHVLAPFGRPIADEDLAVLVERSHPDLHQSLITAVELTRARSEAAAYVSPAMVAAVVKGVEERIADLPTGGVFDLARLRRKTALLAFAGVGLGAAVLIHADVASIWLRRNLFLADQRWPKQVVLELVSPIPPAVVAVGDTLEVAVKATRGSPATVVISSWEESGRAVRADTLSATTTGLFRKAFDNIARPFEFKVRGGDDEIGPFTVEVRLRPRIDMQSVRLWCDYPAYMSIEGTKPDEPLRHGNLKVPAGTKVRYSMSANVPIEKAYFVFKVAAYSPDGVTPAAGRPGGTAQAGQEGQPGPDVPAVWPDEGALDLAVTNDKDFSGEFSVASSGQYYFQLQAKDGFRSIKPERFRIEALPDRKPLVKIVEPESITEKVSADATVRVRVEASDDFGPRKGVLEGVYFPPQTDKEHGVSQSFDLPRLTPGAGEAPGGVTTPADPASKGPGRGKGDVEDEILIRIQELKTGGGDPTAAPGGPAPGARFQFMALVSDFANNIGQSQVHLLEIVDKEDLLRSLTDQLMIVRDQLRETIRRQKSARKDLEEFQKTLSATQGITAGEASKLYRHREDQERVTKSLLREVTELDRILARSASNNVGDEKWKGWVEGVRDDVRDVARRKSPEVEKLIESLRKEALEATREASLIGPLTAAQREVEREVEGLVLRLSEFGDLNALIQLLREVRRRQADLREETRTQVKGAEPGSPGSPTEEPQK
jgi:hypothetical protein